MKKTRCAIYTRKSSEDGLEQDFNSLDAQFEACAAYIASQKHEGWKQLAQRYDDGGISGGTLDRPGLHSLLADIDAGRVDMVVVYKIDRLTRSLADFAKLVERMEAAECSFVSVTQSFNTSSSMGRLTLNMLLSFAQFEREVTAERIRDKIAASKKKGLWMGGLPPLGYDPHPDKTRRELVVNQSEAATIRRLFKIYLEAGCLNAAVKQARAEGLRSKRRVFSSGRVQGGTPFSRGQLHANLTNPVYRGLIKHKDQTWPGTHDAIIEEALWDAVQTKLQAASANRRGSWRSDGKGKSAPLLGKFKDESGDLLSPSHAQKSKRRIHYYVSNRLVSGRARDGWRLPAKAFEVSVTDSVIEHLERQAKRHSVLKSGTAEDLARASASVLKVTGRLRDKGVQEVAPLIASGHIAPGTLTIELDRGALATALAAEPGNLSSDLLQIATSLTCKRRGVETKIFAGDRAPGPDETLTRALRNAHIWAEQLKAGQSVKSIAAESRCSGGYIRRIAPLATLSPNLQEAILAGKQPVNLTLETLVRAKIPLGWDDQERLFGFEN